MRLVTGFGMEHSPISADLIAEAGDDGSPDATSARAASSVHYCYISQATAE
jgi:hypothetical protein